MIESYIDRGIRRWREVPDTVPALPPKEALLRDSIGAVLRERRSELGLTLRQMGTVSISYVSQVERGQKEVSSEVLQTMCQSLDLSLPELLRRTADYMDVKELINA